VEWRRSAVNFGRQEEGQGGGQRAIVPRQRGKLLTFCQLP